MAVTGESGRLALVAKAHLVVRVVAIQLDERLLDDVHRRRSADVLVVEGVGCGSEDEEEEEGKQRSAALLGRFLAHEDETHQCRASQSVPQAS